MKKKHDLISPKNMGDGYREYTIILTKDQGINRTIRIHAQDIDSLMRILKEEYKVGQGEVGCKVRLA